MAAFEINCCDGFKTAHRRFPLDDVLGSQEICEQISIGAMGKNSGCPGKMVDTKIIAGKSSVYLTLRKVQSQRHPMDALNIAYGQTRLHAHSNAKVFQAPKEQHRHAASQPFMQLAAKFDCEVL